MGVGKDLYMFWQFQMNEWMNMVNDIFDGHIKVDGMSQYLILWALLWPNLGSKPASVGLTEDLRTWLEVLSSHIQRCFEVQDAGTNSAWM